MWPLILGGIVIGLLLVVREEDAEATVPSLLSPAEPTTTTTTTTLPIAPSGPKTPTTDTEIKRVAKAMKKIIPKLVAAPDRAGWVVPIIDGKAAWYQAVVKTHKRVPITQVGINLMIVPNFSQILVVFKTLQETVGANADGRIGPDTLNSFIARITDNGFKKHPLTVAQLAANAVKYTTILQQKIPPASVGAPQSRQQFERLMASNRLRAIGPNGQLGAFNAPPRRLQELGLMEDVTRLDNIYRGQFTNRLLEDNFLTSPKLQLQVFRLNMKDYSQQINSNPALKTLLGRRTPSGDITMSGFLGLANCAGLKGAVSWIQNPLDAKRYPNTTKCFRLVNGLF